MMTMPPTISEIEAMPIVTPKNVLLMLPHSCRNDAFVSIAKSSGSLYSHVPARPQKHADLVHRGLHRVPSGGFHPQADRVVGAVDFL